MPKREHDPVYLVIIALGIGLGFSVGIASDKIVWGLVGGVVAGLIGCTIYLYIKRSRKPKKHKTAKGEFKMK